jgi:hypothetical protein
MEVQEPPKLKQCGERSKLEDSYFLTSNLTIKHGNPNIMAMA